MNETEMQAVNRAFYDPLWKDSRLISPDRFNTWPLVRDLAAQCPRRLEIGPGLRPRLPLDGTQFVDLSPVAVAKLQARGALARTGPISDLPFPDTSFDLTCALDILEHVDDDTRALSEIARVTAPGGRFLLSVPLHASQWTPFDDLVGHRRRYEPAALLEKLATHGFTVEQSAGYGMQPKSSRLVDLGMWFLHRHRAMAMRWYNHIFMPLGLLFQKNLTFTPGLPDLHQLDETVLLCRKNIPS